MEGNTSYDCKICGIQAQCSKNWEAHIKGKKHKLKEQLMYQRLLINEASTDTNFEEKERDCQLCNMKNISVKSWASHIEGKKHQANQERYDKEHNTIYVKGTGPLQVADLENIFQRFGQVVKVNKIHYQNFSFIQFDNEYSVAAACASRIFAGRYRLIAQKYNIGPKKSPEKQKDSGTSDLISAGPNKSPEKQNSGASKRKSSEEVPAHTNPEGTFGLKEFPIGPLKNEGCPEDCSLFDWHCLQILEQIELPKETYEMLTELKTDIEELFEPKLPGCKAHIFGSCGSTLAFKGSDVDLFLECVGEQPFNFVKKQAKVLFKSRKFEDITIIANARVPIVKFEHVPTQMKCDLNAKNKLGSCNTQLVRFLVLSDSRIRPLMMLVKYWAKVCGVSGEFARHNGINCYSLVMMVIFYLQQCSPPLLPPVAVLQALADQKDHSESWECSFCDHMDKVTAEYPMEKNQSSLKELLAGFFCFYQTFNFADVICPLLGRSVPGSCFDDPKKLPEEMQLYVDNLMKDTRCRFQTNKFLKVQDPFELGLNITRNVSTDCYFVFKEALEVSVKIVDNTEEENLLKNILSINRVLLNPANQYRFAFKGDKNNDEELQSWFNLKVKSILLVFREIFKIDVKQISEPSANKVQKLDTSDDVHSGGDDFTGSTLSFHCTVTHNVWSSRNSKAVKKRLNLLLNESDHTDVNKFEKECRRSSLLLTPNYAVPCWEYQLDITPLEKFKENKMFIEVVLRNYSQKNPAVKRQFEIELKIKLKTYVHYAEDFIVKHENIDEKITEHLQELNKKSVQDKDQLSRLEEPPPDSRVVREKILQNQNLLLKHLEAVRTCELTQSSPESTKE